MRPPRLLPYRSPQVTALPAVPRAPVGGPGHPRHPRLTAGADDHKIVKFFT